MTIEEKAKRAWEEYCYRADGSLYSTVFEDAYKQGATEAIASQWVSVEERMPDPDTMCLVSGYQDFDFNGRLERYTMMAWYDGEDFTDAYNDRTYHPEMWMAIPIPELPTKGGEK